MEWSYTNWFIAAALAVWSGFLTLWIARVRAAVGSPSSQRSELHGLQRRLTDCESLLSEAIAAIGRINARDKMRQVRAGKHSETPTPEPTDSPSAAIASSSRTLSKLPTAEIRRRLAQRIPITEE